MALSATSTARAARRLPTCKDICRWSRARSRCCHPGPTSFPAHIRLQRRRRFPHVAGAADRGGVGLALRDLERRLSRPTIRALKMGRRVASAGAGASVRACSWRVPVAAMRAARRARNSLGPHQRADYSRDQRAYFAVTSLARARSIDPQRRGRRDLALNAGSPLARTDRADARRDFSEVEAEIAADTFEPTTRTT